MLSFDTFLLSQPCCPEVTSTDRFYYELTCRLIEEATLNKVVKLHDAVLERCALCLIGYYQDMIADAGLWHGFTDECRRLYSTPVPFYSVGDGYVDYELNREDVGFIVWYAVAMYSDDRCISPFRHDIKDLADLWYKILEDSYEVAPVPEGYHLAHELDVYAEEDREMLLKLGSWLFLHSWLLKPAFAYTANEIVSGMVAEGKSNEEIAAAVQDAVKHQPTGPLALYIGEWVHLTVNHKLSSRRQKQEEKSIHPAFGKMLQAADGLPVKFIKGYENFNKFLIEQLGWSSGVNHLEQLKDCRDFVLMVNPAKGLLIATDICRCIAAPSNPYYEKEYAQAHAMMLLTERGVCPHDLLAYIYDQGWLPDAHFQDSDDYALVAQFHDFIERCYLQLYYRGD